MMWYRIPGWPGYRINHRREVLSLQDPDEPVILAGDHVTLCRDGKPTVQRVSDLMARAGLQVWHSEPPAHPESSRDACDQGHAFTPENTMRRASPNGDIRKCRACHNKAMRRYRARKRAGLV